MVATREGTRGTGCVSDPVGSLSSSAPPNATARRRRRCQRPLLYRWVRAARVEGNGLYLADEPSLGWALL